jgi:glutamate synthase domain-containing protein 3
MWDELDHSARSSIKELVELHAVKTGSVRANWMLANWDTEATKFVRLTPKQQV